MFDADWSPRADRHSTKQWGSQINTGRCPTRKVWPIDEEMFDKTLAHPQTSGPEAGDVRRNNSSQIPYIRKELWLNIDRAMSNTKQGSQSQPTFDETMVPQVQSGVLPYSTNLLDPSTDRAMFDRTNKPGPLQEPKGAMSDKNNMALGYGTYRPMSDANPPSPPLGPVDDKMLNETLAHRRKAMFNENPLAQHGQKRLRVFDAEGGDPSVQAMFDGKTHPDTYYA